MINLLNGLKRTLRNLLRAPQFTIPALLVLALGIGAGTAVFGALRTLLFQELPYRSPERIVQIWWQERTTGFGFIPGSWALYEDLHGRLGGAQAVAGLADGAQVLTGEGEPEKVPVGRVTPDFFRVFEVKPLLGTLAWPAGATQGAVLTASFWRRHFGSDPGVLGRSLLLNGVAHPILGVLPAQARLRGGEVFIPFRPDSQGESRYNCYLFLFARLRPGLSPGAFRTELQTLNRALGEQYGGNDLKRDFTFQGFQDAQRAFGRDLARMLLLASGLMLLIAVVNLGGQFLLRSLARATDTAVRTALGASTWQAIQSSLAEAFLVSLGGAVLGLGFAWGGLQLLRPLVSKTLLACRPMELDLGLAGFALLVALAVTLPVGAIPGALLGRLRLAQQLKEGGRGRAGRGSRRIRNLLVALQVAVALTLLAGFGVLSRSMLHLQSMNLGLDPRDLTVFEVSPAATDEAGAKRLERQAAALEAGLQAIPGLQAVGSISHLPVEQYGCNYTPKLPGRELPEGSWLEMRTATPGTFRSLGVPMLQGRPFTEADLAPERPQVAVVSRSAAALCWAGLQPLGQQLGDPSDANWCTVVGIVEDVRNGGPKEGSSLATVYFPQRLAFSGPTTFVVRTQPGLPPPYGAIRKAVREAMPGTPLQKLRTMTEVLARNLEEDRILAKLLGFAGASALALALLGLYGALGYSVLSRSGEFGVRLSLGAQPRQILTLVLREGLGVALCGAGLGLVLALAASRIVAHLLYGVQAMDPVSLGAAGVVLMAGAVVACFLPALRAARTHPSEALRHD